MSAPSITDQAPRWAFRAVLGFSALVPRMPALQDARAFVGHAARVIGQHVLALVHHEDSAGASRVHVLLSRLEDGPRLLPVPHELVAAWEHPERVGGVRWQRAALHASAAVELVGADEVAPLDRLRIVGCPRDARCRAHCIFRDQADPFYAVPAPGQGV